VLSGEVIKAYFAAATHSLYITTKENYPSSAQSNNIISLARPFIHFFLFLFKGGKGKNRTHAESPTITSATNLINLILLVRKDFTRESHSKSHVCKTLSVIILVARWPKVPASKCGNLGNFSLPKTGLPNAALPKEKSIYIQNKIILYLL